MGSAIRTMPQFFSVHASVCPNVLATHEVKWYYLWMDGKSRILIGCIQLQEKAQKGSSLGNLWGILATQRTALNIFWHGEKEKDPDCKSP